MVSIDVHENPSRLFDGQIVYYSTRRIKLGRMTNPFTGAGVATDYPFMQTKALSIDALELN
jgi:hypothetical protein